MKAAVIGAGFIGPVHVEGLRRAGVVVKGVLGIDRNESETAARNRGLERAYLSLDEVLADKDVASVHIASPNKLHARMALAALEAGKHVVCEKPLAMTSKESAALVAAAKKRPGQVAAVNYNLRFYPLNIEARTRVRRGDLGEVFHVRGAYVQDWLLYPDDFNWRVLAEEGGATRAIGDIGTHWLDLVHYITGLEAESVFADLRIVHPVRRRPVGQVETFKDKEKGAADKIERKPVQITTEDYGAVLIRFKGGARASLLVSQVTAGRKNRLEYEVSASRAAIQWISESPNELWIGSREKANEVLLRDPSLLGPEARKFANYPGGHNEGFPDTFKQVYRAIYEDIRGGGPKASSLYATFADGHRELVLCEAILESNRKQAWVKVKA